MTPEEWQALDDSGRVAVIDAASVETRLERYVRRALGVVAVLTVLLAIGLVALVFAGAIYLVRHA